MEERIWVGSYTHRWEYLDSTLRALVDFKLYQHNTIYRGLPFYFSYWIILTHILDILKNLRQQQSHTTAPIKNPKTTRKNHEKKAEEDKHNQQIKKKNPKNTIHQPNSESNKAKE